MSLGKKLIEFAEAVLSWGVIPLLLSTGSSLPGTIPIPQTRFRIADTDLLQDEMAARGMFFDKDIEYKFDRSVNLIVQGSQYGQASRLLSKILKEHESLGRCSSLLVNAAVACALRDKRKKAAKYIEKAENEFRTLPMLYSESYEMLSTLLIDTQAEIEAMK